MSPDPFWATHYTYAEAARKLGTSRQNVYQCCKRGSIPLDRSAEGKPGVPIDKIEEKLRLRKRDVK